MSCDICDSGTITHKKVVARKPYRCCECRREIKQGDEYWYFEACWPSINGWDNFKTCQRCESLKNLALLKWPTRDPEDYPAFGELYDWIRESRR
jgi:hypothetical protein